MDETFSFNDGSTPPYVFGDPSLGGGNNGGGGNLNWLGQIVQAASGAYQATVRADSQANSMKYLPWGSAPGLQYNPNTGTIASGVGGVSAGMLLLVVAVIAIVFLLKK